MPGTAKNLLYTKRGYVLVLALVFLGIFLAVASAYLFRATSYARGERTFTARAQALSLAEAGIDAAVYALNQDASYTGESDTALGTGTFTTSVTAIDAARKRITATGYVPDAENPIATKTVKVIVSRGNMVIGFPYAAQAGTGGITLANSSQIIGDVFSEGPISGTGSNYVYGSVVSAGAGGAVYGIHATSSVYAHALGTTSPATTVDGDAYYTTKTNTTVGGTSYPGSADQATTSFPISDALIGQWEAAAEAGGTITSCNGNGEYEIASSTSLGPKKIECDLVVKNSSGILTVTGPLWVKGNITFQTGPTIRMDSSLGSANVAIIADDPDDATGSGIITVGQNTVFQGSGAAGSFIFLISQNRSAESDGSTAAISMSQGSSATIAYARHGLVRLSQSTSARVAAGYRVSLSQTAQALYDASLLSAVFQQVAGTGSWSFATGTYAIAH